MAETREALFHSSLGIDDVQVHRVTGLEDLGRPFEYHVELLRDSGLDPIDPDTLLGKNVSVELFDKPDKPRWFNGWVTRFEHLGEDGRFTEYRLELRPWIWYLGLTSDCKIFQNKTALEILDEVFDTYSHKLVEKKTQGTYRTRAFCVQYRETDLDFVTRLMEEEGLYYYFEHSEGQHKLVLCDSPSAHPALRDEKLVWRRGAKAGGIVQNMVTSWIRRASVRPMTFTHTDYDFQVPTTSLQTNIKRTPAHGGQGGLGMFDYPGEYDDLTYGGSSGQSKQQGEHLAQMRVNRWQAQYDYAIGGTPCRGAMAGLGFKLDGHPSDNGEYLITRFEFTFTFGSYEAEDKHDEEWGFEAVMKVIKKSTPFLPDAVTPRPLISGPQTAVVVGNSGDEISTEKFGRVKIQLRWDRVGKSDADSSCWVRVSHPWASKQFGMIALPRIGDEVVVEFLDGNPDRPLVTGRVYNALNMPPWVLPDHATISGIKTRSSTGGQASDFNELRFEDKQGSEYIRVQSQKDYHRLIKNDHFDSIGNDSWVDIKNNDTRTVGAGFTLKVTGTSVVEGDDEAHVTLGAAMNLSVGADAGVKVANGLQVDAGQAGALSLGAGFDLKAGASIKISAGASLSIQAASGVVIDGGTQLTIKAGAGFVTLGPDGVSISGPMVKINSGGSAGSAQPADKANPPTPKKPADPKANEDPLGNG